MTTPILPEMIPVRDISQFEDGDRLFYELGYKKNAKLGFGDNWIRTGNFKEINTPSSFVDMDKLMSDTEYLKHHNFMVIKNKTL